jgi:hypothetical protein
MEAFCLVGCQRIAPDMEPECDCTEETSLGKKTVKPMVKVLKKKKIMRWRGRKIG